MASSYAWGCPVTDPKHSLPPPGVAHQQERLRFLWGIFRASSNTFKRVPSHPKTSWSVKDAPKLAFGPLCNGDQQKLDKHGPKYSQAGCTPTPENLISRHQGMFSGCPQTSGVPKILGKTYPTHPEAHQTQSPGISVRGGPFLEGCNQLGAFPGG